MTPKVRELATFRFHEELGALTISWQTLRPVRQSSIVPGLVPKPVVTAHTVSCDDYQTKSVESKNQRVGLLYHWKSASSPTLKQ